jgi:hypothetical protein
MFQPFEPRHIKRYLMLYGGVVLLMIAFYFINTLLNPVEVHEPKVFPTQTGQTAVTDEADTNKEVSKEPSPFKLLPRD